jgi:hypothetical protein
MNAITNRDFFCVSKLSIDLFFKLPVSRFLAIDIEGKIGQLTVRRTSSFIISILDSNKAIGSDKISNTMIISVKNEIAK